ncbi:MAG: GntR family transcriptional regulator [bacterium]|nr:GntR family transcriptional regulator [bacterium]
MINKNIPMPLYYQVSETIRQRIAQNIYLPGQPIPTEIQLQEEFTVSRETIRKAVNNLVTEGLIEKVRGKGTFVAQSKIVHRIGSIYGSTEEIVARGRIPTTTFLEKSEFSPPDNMRREMGLNASQRAVKIRRLRCTDNKPAAILTSYLPVDLVPNITHTEFIDGSLYKTLEGVYHLILSEADEVIEAGSVGEQEADLLKIQKDSPILVVKRLTFLENLRVIEKLKAFYRSDVFKYQVKLKGRMNVFLPMTYKSF